MIHFAHSNSHYFSTFTIGQYLLIKSSNGRESRLTHTGCYKRNQYAYYRLIMNYFLFIFTQNWLILNFVALLYASNYQDNRLSKIVGKFFFRRCANSKCSTFFLLSSSVCNKYHFSLECVPHPVTCLYFHI